MKKFFFATIALAAAMAIMPSAKADAFSFIGQTDLTLAGAVVFNVSGGSVVPGGTVDITGPGTFPSPVFPTGWYTFVTGTPTDLEFALGATDIELIHSLGGWQIQFLGVPTSNEFLTTTATPEPSSLVLLGSGLFLLAAGLFVKSRSTSSAKQTGLTLA